MSLNAIVVGCGAMGAQFDAHDQREDRVLTHAHACVRCPETELVAGVDVDEANRTAFAASWNAPVFETLSDAAAEFDVDLVCVSSPARTHGDVVSDAIDCAARGILCEKPLALDRTEAAAIVDECEQGDIQLAVNYIRRYTPGIRQLKQSFAGGAFGDVDAAVLSFTKGLYENGSHMVDLARWWFGDVESVRVHSSSEGVDATLVCDRADCRLVGTGGHEYSTTRVDVYTESGAIRLEDNGNRIITEATESNPVYPGFDRLTEQRCETTGIYRATLHAVGNVASAIKDDAPLVSPATEAVETLRICSQIDDRA